jgi:RNA polymerase sigma-70 factor, ECF subfamily
VSNKDQGADEVERLYRQHGAALLLFASAIGGDRSRAQDAVQQVFLNLIENGGLAKANDKKPFLFACVRNAILEESKVRRRDAPLDVEAIWFQPPDRDYAEEKNLRHALNALPGDQREVIVLHVWGELTFSDIGGLVGVSANTAASRYRYALAKLRRSMFREEDSSAQFG